MIIVGGPRSEQYDLEALSYSDEQREMSIERSTALMASRWSPGIAVWVFSYQ